MPYRLVYVGLILLAVAAVALGVVFTRAGDPVDIPGPIESVSPLPGTAALPQAVLEVDLEVGYRAEIQVDGLPIDADLVEATGVYTWAPEASAGAAPGWAPGEHTVRVVWRRIVGLPSTGQFEWTFRTQ